MPVLTVLFLVSYGMMTMLIVEQDSVIQTQRNLITVLMTDSKELWGMKGKAISDREMAKRRTAGPPQAPASQAPSNRIPSTQIPSNQAPTNQTPTNQTPTNQVPSNQIPSAKAPANQGLQQQHAPGRSGKLAKPQAERPPVPASDLADHRRELDTI
jgi:hypothetical protein